MDISKKVYTVVGKRHFVGVSKKSGNAYDFCMIYLVYPSSSPDLVGHMVGEFRCTQEFYNSVEPGTVYSGLMRALDGAICYGVEA